MFFHAVHPAPGYPAPAAESGAPSMTEASAVVAIVDDDAGVRSALTLLVRAFGWEPQGYDSAEAFLEQRDEGTACLVLDMRMPGMSGIDLQRELSARGVSLPVVVVTAHGDQPLADAALEAGAMAVLTKPFREEELRYWIERAVALHA